MFNLWTTLKLSPREEKNIFSQEISHKIILRQKKCLNDEVSKYSSPKLPIDLFLLAQPPWKRHTSYPFLFSLLKIMFAFCLKVEDLVRQIGVAGS